MERTYDSAMAISVLTADDVAVYRRIRLEALQTDPDAFGSNYEREAALPDDEWRTRITSFVDGRPGCVFLDSLAIDSASAEPVAVGGIGMTADPKVAVIWGMWVSPKARRRGAARRVLDAAVAWAVERGLTEVTLDVVRTNPGALALYESFGFMIDEEADRRDRADDDPCRNEHSMRLTIG